jgi:sporulation related protein
MADDQNQRTYRSNEPPVRRAPAPSASTSDPLAELARLIGQTDPFAEFGRDGARRTPAPPSAPAAAPSFGANDYFGAAAAPAPQPWPPEASPFGARGEAQQPFATDPNLYPAEAETRGHPAADAGEFEPDADHPNNSQYGAEEEDFYDDAPPTKRRMGVMTIAAVFALAVIGTAGAFGYRALFGSSGTHEPPPVIKADTAPSKIVPATASKGPTKLITDRVVDHPQGEKLVSREEQPVEMKNPPAAAPMPPAQSNTPPASGQPALGSGVISSEPKKIHTIAIHPGPPEVAEGQPTTAAAPPPAPAPTPPPARMAAPAPVKEAAAPPPVADAPAAVPEPPPAPRHMAEARPAAPVQHAAPTTGNAPLSLSPDAPVRGPMRTAAVAAPAPIARAAEAAKGSYAVQVSSQRSEADAQSAFRSLQAKYPNQLGGRELLIHKVELGAKGTYYRAMVGPFATANEAGTLCNGLKAAGGSCIVQRN